MRYTYYFFIWLLIVFELPVRAQQFPEAPRLYYVTVDPETGFDKIVWYSSPSSITDYYKVVIFEIVDPSAPAASRQIEPPVYIPDTTFVNSNAESDIHSVGYSVVAINDLGEVLLQFLQA